MQAALDRATAEGTAKLTGEWPGEGAGDVRRARQSDAGREATGQSDHERLAVWRSRDGGPLGGAPGAGSRSNGPFEMTILNFDSESEGGEIGNGRIALRVAMGTRAGRRIGARPARRAAVKRRAGGGFLSEVTGKHVR